MSEATEINNSNTNATQHVTQQAPVETERTIPYSRFQEVNEAKKALETRLAEIEANQKAETEKRLAEQNEYRKLYDSRAADLAKAQRTPPKFQPTRKHSVRFSRPRLPNCPRRSGG
jgi:hypothetical protein